MLRQQQLWRLADESLRRVGPSGRQGGPGQLLQNQHPAVWPEGPPLQHLQGGGQCPSGGLDSDWFMFGFPAVMVLWALAGRLYLQVGAVSG